VWHTGFAVPSLCEDASVFHNDRADYGIWRSPADSALCLANGEAHECFVVRLVPRWFSVCAHRRHLSHTAAERRNKKRTQQPVSREGCNEMLARFPEGWQWSLEAPGEGAPMLFNTLEFAVFFAVVLALYHKMSHRAQNAMLLVASYFFYACWDWRFVSAIWISTAVDYYVGVLLGRTEEPRKRKTIVFFSISAFWAFLNTSTSSQEACMTCFYRLGSMST
jgi:hypothetical protein